MKTVSASGRFTACSQSNRGLLSQMGASRRTSPRAVQLARPEFQSILRPHSSSTSALAATPHSSSYSGSAASVPQLGAALRTAPCWLGGT